MQRFGIRVVESHFDMFAVCLDCFAADAELSRDLTSAAISANSHYLPGNKEYEQGKSLPFPKPTK
jgi:hypothetical protein